MINKITVTNHLGDAIELELRSPEKSGFFIRSINGLGPSKASINMTDMAASDGSNYNSSRLAPRNLVFSMGFLENPTIENTRQKSYRYWPIKKRVSVKVETDNRTSETVGYVESNSPDIFSSNCGGTISIICPDPYFYSTRNQISDFSVANFEFPFSNESLEEPLLIISIDNDILETVLSYLGDATTGVTMYLHFVGPATGLSISNTLTGEVMDIDTDKFYDLTDQIHNDIIAGDTVVISTHKGNKYVYLLRDGIFYNIIMSVDRYAYWFQLERGQNRFVFDADSGISNLYATIENRVAYEGV